VTAKLPSACTIEDRPIPDWLKALRKSDPHAAERDKRHFAEPHIPAEQHSRARLLALGKDVLKKTRVYLDMKYWIYCRDARAGHAQKPAHTEIWRILSELTAAKRVVCPVTYPILAQTLRNVGTRRQTAEAIDILSQRVAVQPFNVLVGNELHHLWASRLKGQDAVCPRSRLAWTFSGWLMGEPVLRVPGLDDSTVNCMRKCIFDRLAAADFSMTLDALSEGDSPVRDEYDELYTTLNTGAAAHRHEVTSFEAVFLSEVDGTLDTMKPQITDLLARMFTAETHQPAPSPDSPEAKEATTRAANLIYHAYRLKKLTTEFPALHIGAGLHAAARLQDHPYKRGDLWDFRHAHPALAYCSAFLTEKKLGNLLCRPPLNYDKAYGCNVLWNDDVVVEYLRRLR
jgi:hypothetical protein